MKWTSTTTVITGIIIVAAMIAATYWWVLPFFKRKEINQAVEDKNTQAFLKMIRWSENPNVADDQRYYRTYGNKRFTNMSNHPALTGEWLGEPLPDSYCISAGLNPPCKSTAAGAYQIRVGSWMEGREAMEIKDFTPASQDLWAIWKMQQRGALTDVKRGNFSAAISKLKNEWASLPGNSYNQAGGHALAQLESKYLEFGGSIS